MGLSSSAPRGRYKTFREAPCLATLFQPPRRDNENHRAQLKEPARFFPRVKRENAANR